MDRNPEGGAMGITIKVALRKESVDRNLFVHAHIVYIALSLSARRAWIEIPGWPGDVL